MSFADRSLCFLQRMCPFWTSLLAHRPPLGQSTKLCTTVLDVPQCFLGQVLLSSAITYIKTQSVVFYYCVVGWSGGYQKVNCLLAVFSKSMWLCGVARPEWSLEVSIYCGPHTGGQIVVMGLTLSIRRRGLSTGTMGIQDTETLDRLLDGRCIYWCTSSHRPMLNNNISRYQKDIIWENKAKEKERTPQ